MIFFYSKEWWNKRKVEIKIIVLFLFVILQAFLISFVKKNDILYYNSLVPDIWFRMGGWKNFNYFSGKYESYAQLIHIFENFLIYFLFKYKYLNIRIKKVRKLLFYILIIEIVLVLLERVVLKKIWLSGLLPHAQAVSSFCFLVIITWGISLKNYKKIFVLLLSLILIFFVKKNSGIATVIMLLLLYKKEWLFFRISIFINFFISIISLYFKEIMDKLGIIIGVLKEGAFYTLQMRLLIWKEVFLKIIEKNLIFGTKGIITAFPENIIWYFLQPYGLFGIITVLYFIYTKKYKKQYILLLCVLIFQGISYYGLIVVPISYSFFALLGYYASEDILNKDAKKNIYNVMKEEKKK